MGWWKLFLLLCQALPPFHRHLGTSFHPHPFPAEVTGWNQAHGIALARNGAYERVAPTLGATSLGLAAWTVEGQVCCTPKVGAKAEKDNSAREGKVSVRCQVVRRGRLPGVAYSFPAASGHAHGHLRRAQPAQVPPPAHAQGPPRESPRTFAGFPRSHGLA